MLSPDDARRRRGRRSLAHALALLLVKPLLCRVGSLKGLSLRAEIDIFHNKLSRCAPRSQTLAEHRRLLVASPCVDGEFKGAGNLKKGRYALATCGKFSAVRCTECDLLDTQHEASRSRNHTPLRIVVSYKTRELARGRYWPTRLVHQGASCWIRGLP